MQVGMFMHLRANGVSVLARPAGFFMTSSFAMFPESARVPLLVSLSYSKFPIKIVCPHLLTAGISPILRNLTSACSVLLNLPFLVWPPNGSMSFSFSFPSPPFFSSPSLARALWLLFLNLLWSFVPLVSTVALWQCWRLYHCSLSSSSSAPSGTHRVDRPLPPTIPRPSHLLQDSNHCSCWRLPSLCPQVAAHLWPGSRT